jgi:transcriptional regulator with XRE-family HTH domain
MNVSTALKAWRKARGLVQSRAAAALGVPPKTYVDWEQGRHAPRGFALQALTQKLESEKVKPAGVRSRVTERDNARRLSPSPPASGADKKRVTHAKKTSTQKDRLAEKRKALDAAMRRRWRARRLQASTSR